MQMERGAARPTHVVGHFAEHVARAHFLFFLDHDRVRVHVEIFINRSVVGLHAQGRPIGNVCDHAVSDGHSFPFAVAPGDRTDILPLVADARWAEGHIVPTDFAVVVALGHRVVIARIIFTTATRALAAPAATAVTPDLGIHERVLIGAELHRINDIGQVDFTVLTATASILRQQIAGRIVFEPSRGTGRCRRGWSRCRRWRRPLRRRRRRRWRGCRRRVGRRRRSWTWGRRRSWGRSQRGQFWQATGRYFATDRLDQ
jgi:hypothetical protein